MKKCIIAVLVLLLCATSVYALGKKDDTPPSSGSVSTSSSSSATKKTSGKTTSSTSSTSSKATSATTTGRPVTEDEKALHQAAGGSTVNYDAVIVVEGKMPTVQEVREAGKNSGSKLVDAVTDETIQGFIDSSDAITLPPSTIYIKEKSDSSTESQALLPHELEHVAQYQNGCAKGETAAAESNAGTVFDRIITEYNGGVAYETPGTLEYSASEIQDNATILLRGKK